MMAKSYCIFFANVFNVKNKYNCNLNGLFTILLLFITIPWGWTQNKTAMPTHQISPSGGYLIRDGLKLNHLIRGQGIPLVVIGSMIYYSKAFAPELENQFQFIYTDARHFVPNCQESKIPADSLTLAHFAADLEALRKHLNLTKLNLVGHSVHAQIALEYAHQYPDYVGKLIIICGVPFQGPEYDQLKTEHWDHQADQNRKKCLDSNLIAFNKIKDSITPDRQFAVSYHYFAPYNWVDPAYDAQSLLADLRTCPVILGRLFSIIPPKSNLIKKISQLTSATLIVHGRLDFTVPHTAWEGLPALNRNITFILMDSASHNPQTEESTATEFNRHLVEWINTK